ncbi:MAG: tetratricopeptide repeat protein [Proteobacteria bacterium]|uniref:tetratricopeptide repeat protein n=1 Tax=Aquabacterium sp. TaxID=1872578 RepID=UPI0035C6700F|nr:tetratricopeptide repeat protein [Pseudomonadota bacterium]
MHEVFAANSPAKAGLGDALQDMRNARALVIDSNLTSRSILRTMLADLGVPGERIKQVGRYNDARGELERVRYDIVLCDYHFSDTRATGADLLDEVRAGNHLPFSTIFVMVTSEASYAKVAEAAEAALDCYLLKPHTHNELAARIKVARLRKQAMADIFKALEDEHYEEATALCMARVEAKAEYWIYAARIGSELLLRLNRHDEARKLFELIDATKAMPWARLGIARAHVDAGQIPPALRVLDALVLDNPGYADAYDVMGRAHLQAGDFERAYETYQKAVSLTPNNIGRLQKMGLLAFHLGHTDEAADVLERALAMGVTSRSFDFQSVVMLGLTHFAKDDGQALHKCVNQLLRAHERDPRSARLRRMHELVLVLSLVQQNQGTEASRRLKTMAREFGQPDYDYETAGNMMTVLTHLQDRPVDIPDAGNWVQRLADRFCTNKSLTGMLCIMVGTHEPYVDTLRDSYRQLSTLAESCLAQAKSGDPAKAVETLLERGAATGNTRIVELADMLWQRYQAQLAAHTEMAARVQDLLSRYGRRAPEALEG